MARAGKVLVAEDDDNDVVLLQRAFTKAGIQAQIKYFADGEELLEFLRTAPEPTPTHPTADVLLLDLKMPHLGGFEVLQWLKAHPRRRPGQIVVLTASDWVEDIKKATALHADHYIVKPQEPGEFILLAKLLEESWQGQAAA